MALKIFSPGLDQYGPGGTARIKVLVIGGPGSGKTRWSSFFPKPFYADAEAGLSSIADRGKAVAAASVSNSDDMMDVLKFMEQECRKPPAERRYETLVIDTLDAFQRKVKDEWLRKNPGSESFRGFDAWGYLDTKMQLLLTRMLNLDMNIIVTVHYDEKTVTEGSGDNAQQRQVIQLQLQGNVRDQIFNDFDLVGWMGTFFAQEAGQRVQKRGLSFRPTYEKPFLKDRLNVTPSWMEVAFSEQDYSDLFGRVASKLEQLPASEELGVIERSQPDTMVGGALLQGGALPEVSPKDVPLEQHDKPTLQQIARELGVEYKSNTIKSELITAIRQKQAEKQEQERQEQAEGKVPVDPAASAPAETKTDDSAAAAPESAQQAPSQQPTSAAPVPAESASATPEAPAQPQQSQPAAPASPEQPQQVVNGQPDANGVAQTEAGPVDTTTGEIQTAAAQPTQEQAVAAAKETLGGNVISETPAPDSAATAASAPAAPAPRPASQGPAQGASGTCEKEGCAVELAGENQDLVKLSIIKFRKKLCNNHYQEARAA